MLRFKLIFRSNLLVGAASIGLAATTAPALAMGDDGDQRASDSGLQEIVVTAQHREELLKDVPIAVNAVTGDALKNMGISDTSQLVQTVPSLNFTRSGPSGIFVIRGVSTPNGSAGEEGSTAVYVDDVYMPDLASTVNTFNNIERVEVLNGPQGTLFGRNAVGGLIRIMTRDPGDRPEFDGQIGTANYDMFSAEAYASTPLGDNAGINIAFTGQNQGAGFGFDPTLNKRVRYEDYWGLRSKLVINPADNLKITIGGDYYQTNNTAVDFLWPLNYNPTTGVLVGQKISQNSYSEYPNITRIRVWGVSGKAELNLGEVTLTSISAYRKLKNTSDFDVEGLAADLYHIHYPAINRTFQQELRLSSSPTQRLSWQLGGFYLHMHTSIEQVQGGAILRGTSGRIVADGLTDSISAFGEVTYALSPTTHLTGGLRWTSDHRELPVGYTQTTILATGVALPPSTNSLDSVTYTNVTYRAALRQDLTNDINVYASVNKGFKSGQFNLQAPNLPPVRPETIMAYEAGLKGDLLNRHLRVTLAAFHYDIKDYQVRSTYPDPTGVGVITGLYNAAKVKVDGVDFNAEAAITPNFHINGGVSWLNSRFAQFGGPGTGIVAPGYYPAGDGNATGNQTALAPHFTLALTGTYTIPFNNGSELRFTGGVTHKSGYYFEPDNVLHQPAYDVFNGSIEYSVNDHYSVELYMRNIGNELYNVQMATVAPGYAMAGPPRQYGINFKFDF